MRVVYIHGATASCRSFAYIQSSIQASNPIYLNYDRDRSASVNLTDMTEMLEYVDDDLYIICHSLGGIYAVYLQEWFDNVKRVVSLATPFNGSEIASWSSVFLPHYQLFQDITPDSRFIKKSRNIEIRVPWTNFVSTAGDVPWLIGQNDGIVTRSSMTMRDDVDYVEIDRNHYEILQSNRVLSFIKHTLHT